MSIKTVIVEDDLEVLKGLRQVFNLSEELVVLDTFTSAESFLEKVDELTPEVVLMDIGLPKMNGIECVKLLSKNIQTCSF